VKRREGEEKRERKKGEKKKWKVNINMELT
jgi:hypothetical protein